MTRSSWSRTSPPTRHLLPRPRRLPRPRPEPPEDDSQSRITLRLPESVKVRAEEAANQIGQSLNAWLVDAVRDVLDAAASAPGSTSRRPQPDQRHGRRRAAASRSGAGSADPPSLHPTSRTRRVSVMHTFETPGATTIEVRASAGHVNVATDDTDRTTVELTPLNAAGEEASPRPGVEQSRHTVVVHLPRSYGRACSGRARRSRSTSPVPHGISLDLQTGSADLRATGSSRKPSCSTGSGRHRRSTRSPAPRSSRPGPARSRPAGSTEALSSAPARDVNVERASPARQVELRRLGDGWSPRPARATSRWAGWAAGCRPRPAPAA